MQATPPAHVDARPAIVRVACPRTRPLGECGFLRVPLNRRHPNGRTIRIYFERYFRTQRSHPQTSTVLSIEGGPGFSTTADRAARLQLWRPVSAHRDLLLVDLRGTGRSGALNCPAFRHHILPYVLRAGRCAAQIGPKRDDYDTSQSVQDLRAVVGALGIHRLDVYGDSYGSYAAQAFAIRYPHLLRSLVLDGTYQLPGSDPALADLAQSTQSSLRLACERRPGCPAGRHPLALLGRLLRHVRHHPIVGTAPDADGTMTHVRADPDTLGQLVQSGFYYQGVWRDIFAATRSAFAGDTRPLLRLVAETETTDGPNGDPRDFTESLYLSVICHDYPELWPMGTPVSQRAPFIRSALAAYPPGTFAPFTAKEWTGLDYEGALACLNWPPAAFPDPPVSPSAPYPHVPTLILNGDLDNITPLADARVVASRFPDSTLVVMQNSGHVTALLDQNDCAGLHLRALRARPQPGRHVVRPPHARGAGGAVVPAHARRDGARALLAGRPVHPERPPHRRGERVRGRRRAAAMVGEPERQRGRPARRPLVVLRRRPDHLHPPRRRLRPRREGQRHRRWRYSTGRVRATVVTRAGGTVERLRMAWSLQVRAARGRLVGTEGGRTLRLHMLAP